MKGGFRVEANQIIGDLVRRASEKGVATPLLTALLDSAEGVRRDTSREEPPLTRERPLNPLSLEVCRRQARVGVAYMSGEFGGQPCIRSSVCGRRSSNHAFTTCAAINLRSEVAVKARPVRWR
jgi:hypothetical protein